MLRCSILGSVWLITVATCGWAQVPNNQVPDNIARQKIDELQQRDSVLRSEISGARVDRQVEITRLEGRIVQIEEQLRQWQNVSAANQFVFVLERLARESELPTSETSVENLPDDPDDNLPAESKSDSPQAGSNPPAGRSQYARLLAQDFRLSLEIQILDAQAELLEQTQELASLRRLAAKGLASTVQIDRSELRKRRAELHLQRLQQQLLGLRQLHPQYFVQDVAP